MIMIRLLLALVLQSSISYSYTLPSPPADNSTEQRNELAVLHQYENTRTQDDCSKAAAQERISVDAFFGPSTGILTAQEVLKVENTGKRVIVKTLLAVDPLKRSFDRARPFTTDHTLHPCIAKPGSRKSYPSGHAAVGITLSNELANVFPEKRDAILKQGFQIGKNRIIGGVHYPSDVKAGQDLGQQISNE